MVGHAGAGTVIAAMQHRSGLVLVPRRVAHREHVDDHQVELARTLAAAGKAIAVEHPTPDALLSGIEAASHLEPAGRAPSSLGQVVAAVLDCSRRPVVFDDAPIRMGGADGNRARGSAEMQRLKSSRFRCG
jgi:hypothetical protein